MRYANDCAYYFIVLILRLITETPLGRIFCLCCFVFCDHCWDQIQSIFAGAQRKGCSLVAEQFVHYTPEFNLLEMTSM